MRQGPPRRIEEAVMMVLEAGGLNSLSDSQLLLVAKGDAMSLRQDSG